MSDFRVIQGCPCNPLIAPYFALLANEAKATVNSIYRGQDAAQILHAHGKHTQAEIHQMYPAISNPPGRSTHELRSDGVAYGGPVGRPLEWWQQGIDVNDGDVEQMIHWARFHGWDLRQPYSRGVEFHHLNFHARPVPRGATRARIIWLRATLPRH
ncbi:MAG: hypothetical protein ACRDK4_05050 [Solirubrobacteraceae bacterium]